jgi:hypothetical protein
MAKVEETFTWKTLHEQDGPEGVGEPRARTTRSAG